MGLKEAGVRGSLRSTSSVLPAFFDVTITNTNSPVEEGDILTVDYGADNTGDAQDTQDIRLEIDSVQEDVDPDVMLAGGASATGTLEWDTTDEAEAEYTATVLSDDDSDSVTVEIGSAIPDSEDLHSAFDFSQEDGSLPVTDQSGNGRDLTNGSYTSVGGDINGVQAGVFDGADDSVWSDSTSLTPPFTIFQVAELDSSPANDLNTAWSLRAEGPESNLLHRNDNNELSIQGDESQVTGGSQFDTLVTVHIDGANSVLRSQGTQLAAEDPNFATVQATTLGSRFQGSDRFFDGRLGEVLIYGTDKSGSFADIEQYLANKWGISI